jgi:hypothetical protein
MLTFKALVDKIGYEIELTSELVATFVAGVDYGIIEAKWIPTGSLGLPLFGRFSYYHVALLILMAIVGSALAWSHIQWLLQNRKRYVVFICLATVPLSVLIEDITWFLVTGKPITYDEWTMIRPGLGFNLGFTWLPLWYVLVAAGSLAMFYLASKYAETGYQTYLDRLKM